MKFVSRKLESYIPRGHCSDKLSFGFHWIDTKDILHRADLI